MNDVSLSGISANSATFFSPMLERSSSSVAVSIATLSRLNFSSLACKRDLYALERLCRARMICLVILHCDMIRLPHLKIVKEAVKRTVIALVLFAHIACPKHFHDHGEVLFFFRCFILQIEDQCQKQHRMRPCPRRDHCYCEPLGVVAFEQVRHKLLHIIVACDIAERDCSSGSSPY